MWQAICRDCHAASNLLLALEVEDEPMPDVSDADMAAFLREMAGA